MKLTQESCQGFRVEGLGSRGLDLGSVAIKQGLVDFVCDLCGLEGLGFGVLGFRLGEGGGGDLQDYEARIKTCVILRSSIGLRILCLGNNHILVYREHHGF